MDLSTSFMGLKLKNPIIVAAGPLTGNGDLMRKAVEAGASTIQMCTALIINGVDYISQVLQDLGNWMDARGYVNYGQIKGKALASLKSFEEIKINPSISSVYKNCSLENCNKCKIACIYDAISRVNNNVLVNPRLCTGCGLCVSICSDNCFKFVWK